MPDQAPPSRDVDVIDSARIDLERAENADDVTRLGVLDDLYQALEAELDEDDTARS